MSEIKSKTQVVSTTNTKLAVATVALLLAGGLAFATVPFGQGGGQCGVKKKVTISQSCKAGKYRKASFICTNGASYTYFDPNKKSTANCYTKREWQAFATHTCSSICQAPSVPEEKVDQLKSISRQGGSPGGGNRFVAGPTSTPTSTPVQRLQAQAPQEVSSCGALADGEYVLTANVVIPAAGPGVYSTCFELAANTTLRCNPGVTITGGERTIGVSMGNGAQLVGCTFEGVTRAITVGGSQSQVTGNTIRNSGENNEWTGAILLGGDGHVVSGNTIQGSLRNGIYLARVQQSSVRYNNITDSASAAIAFGSEAANNTISSNNLNHNGYGIYMLDTGANTVNENSIQENTYKGVFIRGTREAQITNNQIINNGDEGIRVEGVGAADEPNHLNIQGNTIQSHQRYGMFLSTEENTVQGNRIEGNGQGIYMTGSRNTIQSNTFTANEQHGIFDNTGTGNRIENNEFVNQPAGVVLDWQATRAVVIQNRFTANRTGILVAGGQQNELRGNTLSENQYGIKVQERSEDTLIVDNILTNNSIDGIYLGLSGNEVTREIAKDAGFRLPPPLRTVIQNTRACGNARADLYCDVQQETSGQQNSLTVLTQCASGDPVQVEFELCR